MVEYENATDIDMMQEAKILELDVRNLEAEKERCKKYKDMISTPDEVETFLKIKR